VSPRKHGHHHAPAEECAICSGRMTMEDLRRWERESMAEFGFYVHAVQWPDDRPGLNIHTHGLDTTFPGQLNLQIVLPIPPALAMQLFHGAVNQMREGARFLHGDEDEAIANVKVRFVMRREGHRDLLRMILPDPRLRFPGDPMCMPIYADQEKP
jgi:hypothetical protein